MSYLFSFLPLSFINSKMTIVGSRKSPRVCAGSFVKEKDLPEGQNLLQCGRCKQTCYVSREVQLEHWPYHRHVCVPIERDDPRVRAPLASTQECLRIIHECLQKPREKINGRLLLWAFRCLKWFRENQPQTFPHFSNPTFITAELYNLEEDAKKMIQNHGYSMIQIIWSIPGWVDFFLSDELLLTKSLKELKSHGHPAPKPPVILDGETGRIDPETMLDPSCVMDAFYCQYIFTWINISCFQMKMMNLEQHIFLRMMDSCDHKNSPLVAALVRQQMTLWRDRYNTAACSSYSHRNKKLFDTLLVAYRSKHIGREFSDWEPSPYTKPTELVPGMTVVNFFEILQWENSNFFWTIKYKDLASLVEALVSFDGKNPHIGPWNLPPEDRVHVLDLMHDCHFPENDTGGALFTHPLGYQRTFPTMESALLFLASGHCCTKTLLDNMLEAVESDDLGLPRGKSAVVATYIYMMTRVDENVIACLNEMEYCMHTMGHEYYSFPDDLLKDVMEYALPVDFKDWELRVPHGGKGG